jgi:flagellar hook-associated protein 3 FlgL
LRITNSILARNALLRVREGLSALDEAQQQVATGLRLNRPSDDPSAAADVLCTDRRLRALDQYQRNIGAATGRLATQESAIDQTALILERAREIAIGQASSTADPSTRAISAAEADRLIESVIQLGNSHFGSGYLFGGAAADRPPFAADGTTDPLNPPAGAGFTEVGENHTIATSFDANRAFVSTGAITALQQLSAALKNDDVPGISAAEKALKSAIDDTQGVLGELGARVNQLELALTNAEALDTSLRARRSELAEVDFEEAVTALLMRQTSLQAAFESTSRLLTTTLTDYLR